MSKASKGSRVDDYLSNFSGKTREKLDVIRKAICTQVPDAVESFSYGLVGYKLHGKPLVYFGGFKNHIGFYATPNGHDAFSEEFSKYKQGKGSVQFPLDTPLPIELIQRVVEYRKNQTKP